MKESMKRLICLILTFVMVLGLIPQGAFVPHVHAAEADAPDYRWELDPTTRPYLISSTENGITENAITLASGITVGEDGSFTNGYKGKFATAVALDSDKHWVIEWKVTGDWKGELLSQRGKVNNTKTSMFIRRDSETGLVALGSLPTNTTDLSTVDHYGITVPTSRFDANTTYTWCLENKVAADGSNMVYLLIDGEEIGALNTYYLNSVADTSVDGTWVNGQDFSMGYIGANDDLLTTTKLEYLQIWLNKPVDSDEHVHDYQVTESKAATCKEEGFKTYTCSCGDTYTETIAVDTSKHNYSDGWISKDGEMRRYCNACGQYVAGMVAYRWEMNETGDGLTSVTTDGNIENALTVATSVETLEVSGGAVTDFKARFASAVELKPDQDWVIEWKSNEWQGMMLSSTGDIGDGAEYFFRNKAQSIVALGVREGTKYSRNYGSAEVAKNEASHVWRVENRVNADGTNMVYLKVDGGEAIPMNKYYVGGTSQNATSDWVVGNDFTFQYLGATGGLLNATQLEYIQIWTNGALHEHDYEEVVTTGTCIAEAVTTKTCKYDKCANVDIVRGELNPDNHPAESLRVDGAKEPTCKDKGYTGDTVCVACNATVTKGEDKAPTGQHAGGTATCMAKAICSTCGQEYGEKNPDYHTGNNTEGVGAKAATCIEEGYTGDTVCECSVTIKEGTVIAKVQHSDAAGDRDHICDTDTCTQVVTEHAGGENTCKEGAVCSECGETYGQVDPTKHTGGTRIENKQDATCGATGYTGDTVCNGCDQVTLPGTVTDKLTTHSWGEWETVTDPTETEAGSKKRECSVCHEIETGEIAALGHTHSGVYTEALEATCGADGYIAHYSCRCGEKFSDEACQNLLTEAQWKLPATGNHTDSASDGEHNCDVCPATNVTTHSGVATCMAAATCTDCGETFGVKDMNNHTRANDTVINQKDATCGAAGYTGDIVCECGTTVVIGEDTQPTGNHTDKADDGDHVCDVCFQAGVSEHTGGTATCQTLAKCSDCGQNYGELAPNNHSGNNKPAVNVQQATCGAAGYTGDIYCECGALVKEGTSIDPTGEHTDKAADGDHKCDKCGAVDVSEHTGGEASCIAAKVCTDCLQSYGEKDSTKHTGGKATCMAAAVCSDCGKSYGTVDAENHTGNNTVKNTKEATCSAGGYTGDTYCECGALVKEGTATEPSGKHSYGAWEVSGSEMTRKCNNCDATETAPLNNYRWEMNTAGNALTSVTENGNKENALTVATTTPTPAVSGGALTNYKASFTPVELKHDQDWVIEWKSTGDWKGMLLSSTGKSTSGSEYLWRNNTANVMALGTRDGKTSANYAGISLADKGIDMSKTHVWRVENRVAADGTNMVYLVIDDIEIGAMNNYYKGSTSQNTTHDWIVGQDFEFKYIGADGADATNTQRVNDMTLEYIQIWAAGAEHKHAYTLTSEIAADCVTAGVKNYICYCGYTNTVNVGVDSTKHTGNTHVEGKKDATCKEAGHSGNTVCECGTVVEAGNTIPMLTTHSWGEWTTIKPATEQETGLEEHKCSVCEKTEQRTIPLLSHVHTPKKVEAVAATCGAAGNIEHWTCTSCGRNYSEEACQNELAESDIILPATGNHTAKETVGVKNATCGEDGYTGDVICECGHTITKGNVVPATGKHTYSDWAFAQGTMTRKCNNCDAVETVELESYRWEMNAAGNALVSVTSNGNKENALTTTNGSVSGGVLTGYASTLTSPVILLHNSEWVIEWKSSGNWTGMFLSTTGNDNSGSEYLYRNSTGKLVAFGVTKSKHQNYGVALPDQFDATQSHTWRVENRVAADGSNMVYLVIDDIEIGAMNNYYENSDSQNTTSDWLNGKDFTYKYIGATNKTGTQLISNMDLDYLQIWTGGTEHKHAYTLTSETAADCVTPGKGNYTCYCGATTTVDGAVDPEKHTNKTHIENKKDATCEGAGYSGDTVCECGKVLEAGAATEKLNHNWSAWTVIEAATEEKAGSEKRECSNCKKTETRFVPRLGFAGKTVSILGDSISTYVGVSNDANANSTIGGNALYYSTPGSNGGIYQEDTWWQQTIDILDLELLVNNSWSGSEIFDSRRGADPAYIDRCVQLHNDHTNEDPDIIFSFMGTNDMSYLSDNLGTPDVNEDKWGTVEAINFQNLIKVYPNGTCDYAEPKTVFESYAIMLHKMTVRYPNTEIYVLGLMARRDPVAERDDVGQPTAKNAGIKKLAEHFGCTFIDLESCISSDPLDFDACMEDRRVHPSKEGHDRMTEAIVGALQGSEVDVRKVTYNLVNATTSNNDHSVLAGSSYETDITLNPDYASQSVKVTMGGVDITESCYANGKISIGRVTGNIVITATARNPETYRWEYNSTSNALEPSAGDGYTANALSQTNGSVANGQFTDVAYKLTNSVLLSHDTEWSIEWKSSGDWKGMMLSSSGNIDAGSVYMYRNNSTDLIAFGYREGGKSYNYGLVPTAAQFDVTQPHVWRLENRVKADGTNMVYLVVDGEQIGAMNNYYVGSTNQNTTVDWLNGRDLTFMYIGASTTQYLSGINLEYLQVCTDSAEHVHAYEVSIGVAATCSAKGSATYTCYCGHTTNVETEFDPNNHSYGDWIDVNGTQQRTCNACGHVQSAYGSSYRWEMNQAGTALENKTATGFVANALVNPAGTVSGGKLTGYYAELTNPVILNHDQQWAIQWECTGTWNSMLMSATKSSTDGDWFLFSNTNNIMALGRYGKNSAGKSAYINYGVDLDNTFAQFDWTVAHTWRLENRVASDGSNMVWLLVDGQPVGAMNTKYEGSNQVAANDNSLSGQDIIFRFIGTSNKPLETKLSYLQIWPDDETHTHKYVETGREAGDCGKEGTITYTCSCGDSYTESDGVKADHVYGEWVVENGIMHRECKNCDAAETRVMSTYRWELNSEGNELVSVTTGGSTKNPLTITEGNIQNGVMSTYASSMESAVVLTHDNEWVIEWKSRGDWKGMLLLSNPEVTTEGTMYLYRNPDNDMIVMGIRKDKTYHNHGIMMEEIGMDFTREHVWRLENRIASDGSNMVYLLIDGEEIGAMNQYYKGSAPQAGEYNWLNGQDFTFNHIGSNNVQQLISMKLDYLQIWPCANPHLHQYQETSKTESTCSKVGETIYTCSSCGESYTESSDVIIPHDFGEWTDVDGIKYHTCKECGAVESENYNAYRWEPNFSKTDLISVTADGSQSNALTKVKGTVSNGLITDYAAAMEKKITLAHDKNWVIEWSSAGDWKGMMLLSAQKDIDNTVYLYRNNSSAMIAFGVNTSDVHHNYGIQMTDSTIDWTAPHVWRLENRIAEDGSNMVYLMIDDIEIGAMNNYFKASEPNEDMNGNWLNGKDLTFGYIGSSDGKELNNINLNYLQIWTESATHKHSYVIDEKGSLGSCMETITYLGVCSCGETTYIPGEEYGAHVYSDWTVVVDHKERTCAVCGIVDTVSIGASYDVSVSKNYYKILSQKNYVLCDGVTESQIILNNAAGDRRQVLNVVEVDTSNPNVEILPAYYGIDKDLTDPANWSAHTMGVTMDYYRDELGYNVVAGMNTALDYDTTAPVYFLVYNGKVLATNDGVSSDTADSYMAVIRNEDGTVTCELRGMNEPLTGNELHAVACNFGFTVKNGKLVKKSVSRSGMSVRSMIGVKKDGSLILVQAEGENPTRASGLNTYEMGETMLALGCVWAINGDGGGSSQIYTKREGESTHSLRNHPSDGTPRATSNGIIIATKASSDGVFDHVSMLPEYEYITPKGSVKIEVKGVDGAGSPAELPDGITYKATGGTFKKGVFKADGTEGVQTVTAYYEGKEVGSVKINVVAPTEIYFTRELVAAPYGKSVDLPLKGSYGSYEVALCSEDVKFKLSEEIGTIEGFVFTAVTDDEVGASESAELTATSVYDKKVKAKISVLIGKDSESVYDFEDRKLHGWYRAVTTDYNHVEPGGETSIVNKNTGKVHSGKYAMAVGIDYSNNLEGGFQRAILRPGEKKVFENATSIGMWVYFPDEADGLSLYMTVPVYEDKEGKVASSSVIFGFADVFGVGEANTTDTGFVYAMDESGWRYISVDVSGHTYVGVPILQTYICQKSGKNGYNYGYQSSVNGQYVLYVDDITVDYSQAVVDREVPIFSGMTYNAGGAENEVNGNAVSTGNLSFTATVADDMTKINYTGIDQTTGRVYVDGMDRTASMSWSADGKQMMLNNVYLSSGMHTIKFGVCDYEGNYNTITRSIIVGSADSAKVKVVPHDPMADRLLLGSLYYIDVVADDPETISSVKVTMDLNNISVWELDHMDVAEGFEATYSLVEDENIATVTITSTGSTNLRGNDQILVSIPTRTWELEPIEPTREHTNIYMYDSYKAYNAILPMDLTVEIDAGHVSYKSGASSTFTSPKIQVDTEMCGNGATGSGDAAYNYIGNEPWYAEWNGGHDHRSYTKQYYMVGSTNHVDAVKLEDKAATCTEEGYSGRTFCEVCKSVVTWGTTTPAKGHENDFVDGVLKCTVCGERFNGNYTDGKFYVDGVVPADGWINGSYIKDGVMMTGVKKVPSPDNAEKEYYYDFGEYGVCADMTPYTGVFKDGKNYYYAYSGVLKNGWQVIDEEYYYFSTKNNAAASGKVKVDGVYFNFEENGRLITGTWVTTDEGRRYYYGPGYYQELWAEIEGDWYYFKEGYVQTGIYKLRRFNYFDEWAWTDLGEEGKFTFDYLDGFFLENDKYVHYAINGVDLQGLHQIGSDFYFFASNGRAAVGEYYAWETHCSLPCGTYTFGPDGKMLNPPEVDPIPVDPTGKDGLSNEADGIYYCVNGEFGPAGITKIGDYYYFVSSKGRVATGSYYCWATNCEIPCGTYEFDEQGRMLNPPVVKPDEPVDPSLKNGLVQESDGIYYYVNGKYGTAGITKIGDYYYFVSSKGRVATGEYNCWATNCEIPCGVYKFDEQGRMLNPPVDGSTVKNGLVQESDGIYYYVNGKYGTAGITKIGDYYYFVSSKGRVATGEYNCWATNCEIPCGVYKFDEQGRMLNPPVDGSTVKNGLVQESDGIYYYVNGKYGTAGITKIGDYYYFVSSIGRVATGSYHCWATNCEIPCGTYKFDSKGRMLNPPVEGAVIPPAENGLVEQLDGIYYYVDGEYGPVGITKIGDYYYFVSSKGRVATGSYYCWATNCEIPCGNYEFDSQGRMLNPPVDSTVKNGLVQESDGIYYYVNGKHGTAGITKIGDYYYFVSSKGRVATGTYNCWATNCEIPCGIYEFDSEGRMLNPPV